MSLLPPFLQTSRKRRAATAIFQFLKPFQRVALSVRVAYSETACTRFPWMRAQKKSVPRVSEDETMCKDSCLELILCQLHLRRAFYPQLGLIVCYLFWCLQF